MRLLHALHRQGLVAPVFALALASFILTGLVAYRIVAGAEVRHAYLVWNLFLAWLPLGFAVLAAERRPAAGGWRDGKFLALGLAWLMFFPNAPYIFTDVVHLFSSRRPSFWVELVIVLLGALTGFLAGFLSLQVMHRLVARACGCSQRSGNT